MTDSDQDRILYDLLAFDALDDGLLVVNDDRRILWCNPDLARIFAIRQEEAIGMDVRSLLGRYLLPTIEDEASARLIRQTLENGADRPSPLCRTRTPDGSQRWLLISGIPAHADTGNGLRVIRIRDATGDVTAHHFRTALDQSPVVVFAQDRDLRYVWSYNQQLGPTDTSILGRTDPEVFLPDDAARLTALKRRVLETGDIVRAEATLTVGNEVHIRDLTLKSLQDAEGSVVGITGTAFDVTERDRAEETLRKRTYDLDQRMDELRCLYSITHLVEVPGITLDALLQAVADTLPSGWQYPDDTAVRITVDGREYRRGDPRETPWIQRSPIVVHGVRIGEVEVRYIAEKPEAAEGPFLREERMLLDAIAERLGRVIERLRAEAALQKSEEMFRGIAQRSFDLIVTSYLADGLHYASPAVERILGYCPEEMAGTDLEDYILPSSLPAWGEGRRKVLRGEQVEGLRIEVRRKDGENTILELSESPIVENGAVVGFQAVGRDISERILYERLREQALDLNARNIAQFAVLADHVRHPLQVVMGVADLLDDEETAEKLREQVRRINMRISQLDREWMESRKIREFLKRYEL
ncbi:PAS domain S-box protein [Methanoculleus sp. UBA303]|jgi:PAS domain S-box-containing protein|uniref:PAS domain S-box protein n=1 Tax=Methanoculleus sp. UBA303 TaxID=1915497 RepID=UPI0025E7E0F6|nr:PAS domain S-box protein [Methanoculleus sp. UBA303]